MSHSNALPAQMRQQPVLIIDDSRLQREITDDLLRSLGFTQRLQASDGCEALLHLRQCTHLPLLIVDLEMPHMDGIELLQHLAEEHILAPVIIASGCEAGLIHTVENMLHANGLPFLGSLGKPVCGKHLQHLLQAFEHRPATPKQIPNSGRQLTRADLEQALAANAIVPFYQPKVALRTGRLIGYEVLARWQTQEQTLIGPAEFIPLARQYNCLSELTFQLLEKALQDQTALRLQGLAPCFSLNLDINLLAERHFAEHLIKRVQAAGSFAHEWILEITESALMHDPASTLASVGRLRLAGFGLSIDDYGTGFSTLKQLSQLPFTELKIDRAFIAEAHRNLRARGILQSAIAMGRTLNLPCVAEGIEHTSDVQLLLELGCYAGQGYLFARPMSSAALSDWHPANRDHLSLAPWLTH